MVEASGFKNLSTLVQPATSAFPMRLYVQNRDPRSPQSASADFRQFIQGDFWLNFNNGTNPVLWLLAYKTATFGNWIRVAGGSTDVEQFTVDTFSGTATSTVVLPDGSGNINVNGRQVVAGTNPVRTDTAADFQYYVEVQISQATAVSTLTANGISHFNSAEFSVDANGFVSATSPFAPFNYVLITTADSPYTATATDFYIATNSTAGPITIRLPNAPTTNRMFIIKDRFGQDAINNVLVTTVGGVVTIDGLTTYTMNSNYQAINLLFNGTSYEVF